MRISDWSSDVCSSDLRQDSVATTEGQEVRTSSFLRATDVVVCSQIPGQDWACSTSSRPANDDGVFGSVTEQLAGSSVTAREAEVDGRAVRCFAFDGPSGTGEDRKSTRLHSSH